MNCLLLFSNCVLESKIKNYFALNILKSRVIILIDNKIDELLVSKE